MFPIPQRRRLCVVVIAGLMAGCSTVPKERGPTAVRVLVDDRLDATYLADAVRDPASDAQIRQWLGEPLTAECAVRIAYLRSPKLQVEYARLGVSRAEVLEASRISNPTLAASALRGDHVRETSIGISQSFADLILLPSRKRLAAGEYERTQHEVAGTLVEFAADVETAWYRYASAQQVAQMRDAVRDAAVASAELAQRFHDAGNLTPLQLALEQAAASSARIQAAHAAAEATRTRLALAVAMGIASDVAELPPAQALAAPVADEDALEALLPLARAQRLDLLSARQEVIVRDHAAADVRRFRLLGTFELGLTRDRTEEGRHLTGPTLSLGIPVFNQGQGPVARAEALSDGAHAELALLTLAVDNDVRTAVAQIAAARDTVEQYRGALLPLRETVVKRTQENVNYMLAGVFELILTKQQEFDAYQSYLEAVRDYWLARVDGQRAVGGRLPSDSAIGEPTIGVDSILNPPTESGHGHHGMHGGHDMSGMKAPVKAKDSGQTLWEMKHGDHAPAKPADAQPEQPMDHSQHDMSGMKHAPAPAQTVPAKAKTEPMDDMPGMKHDDEEPAKKSKKKSDEHADHDHSSATDSGDLP